MTDTNHNGVADELEAEYTKEATGTRFKQQFAYGVGAAMVFGVVSAFAGYLFKLATAEAAPVVAGGARAAAGAVVAGASVVPAVGLVALAVMGIGLLYLSAKYLSENVVRDQALQARQIGAVTKGKVKELEPEIQQPSGSFPAPTAMTAPDVAKHTLTDTNTPLTRITAERALADTIVARGAANENTKPTADAANASWQDKALATMHEPQTLQAKG